VRGWINYFGRFYRSQLASAVLVLTREPQKRRQRRQIVEHARDR